MANIPHPILPDTIKLLTHRLKKTLLLRHNISNKSKTTNFFKGKI